MSKKHGRIVGKVIYSAGDGVEQVIPVGLCEVEVTSMDATITWRDDETDGVAAIPIDTYTTYLADGSIAIN